MTCNEDPTTEITQMKTTYTSVDEPITISSVLSLDLCEAMCTENVSQCSTIEYNHIDQTCNIYKPSTRQSFTRYVSERENTTVSTNICWKGCSTTTSYNYKYSVFIFMDINFSF